MIPFFTLRGFSPKTESTNAGDAVTVSPVSYAINNQKYYYL